MRRVLRADALLPAALLAVTALMVVYPLAMVLYGSVRDAAPGQASAFTLEHWRAALTDAGTFRVLATSLAIAVPRTVLALLLATFFAWCLARTTTPGDAEDMERICQLGGELVVRMRGEVTSEQDERRA